MDFGPTVLLLQTYLFSSHVCIMIKLKNLRLGFENGVVFSIDFQLCHMYILKLPHCNNGTLWTWSGTAFCLSWTFQTSQCNTDYTVRGNENQH